MNHLRWSAGGNAVKTSLWTTRAYALNFAGSVDIENVCIVQNAPTKAFPPPPYHIRIEDKSSCTLSDTTILQPYLHTPPHSTKLSAKVPTNETHISPFTITFMPLHRPTDTYIYPTRVYAQLRQHGAQRKISSFRMDEISCYLYYALRKDYQ